MRTLLELIGREFAMQLRDCYIVNSVRLLRGTNGKPVIVQGVEVTGDNRIL